MPNLNVNILEGVTTRLQNRKNRDWSYFEVPPTNIYSMFQRYQHKNRCLTLNEGKEIVYSPNKYRETEGVEGY